MNLTPPKTILTLCCVASVAALIAGLGGAGLAVRELLIGNTVAQTWFFLGSQVLITVCAVFGLLAGLNRFGDGPALAMVVAGGGALTAGVLGEPVLIIGGAPMVMLGVRSTHIALLEIGIGGVLAGLGALTVLSRRPRESLRYLATGAALLAPLVLVAAAVMIGPVRRALLGLNPVVGTVLAVGAFLVLSALFASGVHCVIRAFETGCPPLPTPPRKKKSSGKKSNPASASKPAKPAPDGSGAGKAAPKPERAASPAGPAGRAGP